MKTLSQTKALIALKAQKNSFQKTIAERFEHKAKDCASCPTKGVCCTDAHFVNVHITRLEATAIAQALKKLGAPREREVYRRVEQAVEDYKLEADGDSFAKTFACPLFEKPDGCLVHHEGKPAPCIHHACYENREDLPPDELLIEAEEEIERLNRRTYGKNAVWLPLPIWLKKLNPYRAESAD